MPKRPLIPVDQAESSQKSPRAENDDVVGPIDVQSKYSIDSSSDREEALQLKLAFIIFNHRPQRIELHAIDYLIHLGSISAPKADKYLEYIKKVFEGASATIVAKTWNTIKKHFVTANKEDHVQFEHLFNFDSFVVALSEATELTDLDVTIFWKTNVLATTTTPTTTTEAAVAAATYMMMPKEESSSKITSQSRSKSTSHSSGHSNSSSNNNPTLGQIINMKSLFKANFDEFESDGWVLPSGAVIDDRLREAIDSLGYESALHSFVIDNVDVVLKLFEDQLDQKEIKRMMANPDEELPALSAAELEFLDQYALPPEDLIEFLYNHGCGVIAENIREKPSREFQEVAHSCITQVVEAYKENCFTFPGNPSESWYSIHLWGFLRTALSCSRILEYRSGEVASEASGRRRNKGRTSENRQVVGHKVDGMAVMASEAFELFYMEISKKNGGANTTKSLHDTRKLLKLMKDSHDDIRKRTNRNVRDQLVTFGLRISGPSASIFSLRQRPGRFYQAISEPPMVFPRVWRNSNNTNTIIAIITWILMLRKAILAMQASVTTWTELPKGGRRPITHDDCRALTMTTPQLLPSIPINHASDIPPLDV
ncbi:hypothetical protein FBU30_001515 [Linnemannia zychae]|nr:hypothetical protein FBU30_001515 [Linnemannia zychae]